PTPTLFPYTTLFRSSGPHFSPGHFKEELHNLSDRRRLRGGDEQPSQTECADARDDPFGAALPSHQHFLGQTHAGVPASFLRSAHAQSIPELRLNWFGPGSSPVRKLS